MPEYREAGMRNFLKRLTRLCNNFGFRIECLESYGTLAIFDEHFERPASFPVAAFAKSIGARVKGLKMQAIMPPE